MKADTAILRLLRSAEMWGWRRTVSKVSGRLGIRLHWKTPKTSERADISFIGCGQAARATLCYFLRRNLGNRFLLCFDTDPDAAALLRDNYAFLGSTSSAAEAIENEKTRYLYIASNHASHTAYAVAALQRGRTVFCEKPLCVSWEDLRNFRAAIKGREHIFFAGYNRPFSPAVAWLREQVALKKRPFTLNCTIHGHFLEDSHWYRHPEEGTRIAGNMSHWLDLAVHLFHQRGTVPKSITINFAGSEGQIPLDDNIVVVLTTDTGDLVSVALNSRHEPFEGIREVIDYQDDRLAVHISDFRELRWWRGAKRGLIRYPLKDVGHETCTLQPFVKNTLYRSWQELELTTALTLALSDLARRGGGTARFDVAALALVL